MAPTFAAMRERQRSQPPKRLSGWRRSRSSGWSPMPTRPITVVPWEVSSAWCRSRGAMTCTVPCSSSGATASSMRGTSSTVRSRRRLPAINSARREAARCGGTGCSFTGASNACRRTWARPRSPPFPMLRHGPAHSDRSMPRFVRILTSIHSPTAPISATARQSTASSPLIRPARISTRDGSTTTSRTPIRCSRVTRTMAPTSRS